jgi:hypothetical protein
MLLVSSKALKRAGEELIMNTFSFVIFATLLGAAGWTSPMPCLRDQGRQFLARA